MKNKKGFTLVELLAVIAILAILVIMALPAVLRMFNQARIDTFSNEINTILRTAKQQYLLDGGNAQTWTNADGSTNKLPLTGNSKLKYYVKMNGNGQITNIQVTNGEYQYSKSGIVEDVVKDDIKVVSELSEEDKLVIDGNGGEKYLYTSMKFYGAPYEIPEYATYYDNYNDVINLTSHPAFTRLTVEGYSKERQNVWCINGSDGYNSCDDNHPEFFSTENECNNEISSWDDNGITYSCAAGEIYKSSGISTAIYTGFVKDGNVYYFKPFDTSAYEDNKSVLLSAFGSSNCETSVVDYREIFRCTIGDFRVSAYADGSTSISDDDYYLYNGIQISR